MARDFKKRLAEGTVVFDGAMGTTIFSRGVFINRCYDELNLSNPKMIEEIHREYVDAGAEVIETNTWGANRYKLGHYDLQDRVEEINREGARIARKVAGDRVFVAGSIGPLGVRIEPWGPVSLAEAREAFEEQARGLIQGGVDLFILETFSDLREIEQAMAGVKDAMAEAGVDLAVVAQMTIEDDGNSLYGTEPEVFTTKLDEWGADVIGVNCSVGPKGMLDCVQRMREVTDKPISVQPNAGRPTIVDGRSIYLCSPDYMANYARRFIEVGATVVGGCCGTTSEHIKKISQSVKMLSGGVTAFKPEAQKRTVTIQLPDAPPPVPMEEKSRFAAKLARGEFVSSCELSPPRGWSMKRTYKRAKAIKDAGFDAINIPDGPKASARVSALATAVQIEREVGIETIMHYVCRDRNLLGMQADLLGAYAMGLRNILVITGDPPILGDYPEATAVFDVDSIGLVNVIHRLNSGFDLGKKSIGKPTGWLIGVGVNPTAINPDRELKRFYWKVDAGAEFAITQPVFDPDQLVRFLDEIQKFSDIPIIAGIWPLQSLRNAEFLANEVPGVSVPDSVMRRMAEAGDPESERKVGEDIAIEILMEVRDRIQGVQVSAPFNRVEPAVEVLRAALQG